MTRCTLLFEIEWGPLYFPPHIDIIAQREISFTEKECLDCILSRLEGIEAHDAVDAYKSLLATDHKKDQTWTYARGALKRTSDIRGEFHPWFQYTSSVYSKVKYWYAVKSCTMHTHAVVQFNSYRTSPSPFFLVTTYPSESEARESAEATYLGDPISVPYTRWMARQQHPNAAAPPGSCILQAVYRSDDIRGESAVTHIIHIDVITI